MFPLFTVMATCPPDYEGAEDFREAMKHAERADGSDTRGYSQKEIALSCDVPESLVSRWCQVGNIPPHRKAMLPPEVRCRFAELQARRDGALVVERDLVRAALDFIGGFRPAIAKATLGPVERGPLTRRQEKVVA